MVSAFPRVVSELQDVHDLESTGLLIKRNRSERWWVTKSSILLPLVYRDCVRIKKAYARTIETATTASSSLTFSKHAIPMPKPIGNIQTSVAGVGTLDRSLVSPTLRRLLRTISNSRQAL